MGNQHDGRRPRYVVLVTDGPPSGNCATMYDDCTNAEQQAMNITKDTTINPPCSGSAAPAAVIA